MYLSVVQMLLEHRWALCHDCFPGDPAPEPDYPLGEEPFPNTQCKPSLTQLQAIPLGPVTGCHREDVSAGPTSSHMDVEDHNEVLPLISCFPG